MTTIEYIQSTGTQYIDTGVIATSDISFEISFQDAALSGGDPMMIGYRPNTWSGGLAINNGGSSASTNIMYLYFGGDGNAGRISEMSSGIVKLANGYREVDGVRSTFTPATFTYHHPMYVFAANNVADGTSGGDTPFNNSQFKLRYLKIWNGETLVRDFIPVLDDFDVACLYDRVSETFYYNLGSGAFIPGDPIIPPPPPTGEFPITIQKNNSEPIHITKDLTNILATNVWLKEDTSIIDPVFVLEAALSDLIEANYVTVPTFGRSYFITNITSISTDLVELTCHVDVLSSFADEIKANKGIIFRQEHDWNLYLNDGVIQAYQNPIVTTQLFPKGFTQQNFVLVAAGSRGIGSIGVGQGGSIDINVSDGGGAGNTSSKTTAGLITYCKAQIGNPYWFGTFGNIASQALLDYKREQYPTYYPDPGSPDFTTQFGQRVHDCVGLIKGYRWSDTPASVPQYVISEDVDVRGLYTQCNRMRGNVDFSYTSTLHLEGMLVFDAALTHVGVYIGNGKIIEAQGHAYGVVQNDAYDRRAKFTLWGVPDWLQVTTSMS